MTHVSVTCHDATRHECWDDAIEHLSASLGMPRGEFSLRYREEATLLYAASVPGEPAAWIGDPVRYQAAKSRGDLEDQAQFLSRVGGFTFRPGSTRPNNMSTILETTETEAGKLTAFHVVRKPQWRGRRYQPGDTMDVPANALRDPQIVAWLNAGWIVDARDGKPAQAAAKPKKSIPQTLSAELPLARQTAGEIIAAGRGEFVQVPRALIDPAPYNPRKTFREVKLQELAASIKTDGIIEPLIVRPVPGGRFEIVAGERRWRASGIAWPHGTPTLPCIVREMDKVTAIRVQGIENLLRDDLNAIEECGWYDALMTEGGYKVKDIMRETGLSEPTIYARLKLKDCPPEIKKAVENDLLPASTAEKVARVEDPELRREFAQAILHPSKHEPGEEASGVLSFRQALKWLETAKVRVAREADWKAKVKSSPVAKTAAKVLSAEESDQVIGNYGGYLKNPQMYVKPVDICPGDPEQRTYAEVAKAAGRELPAPIVARDGSSGKPVVILSRAETERVLVGLVPTDQELQVLRATEAENRRRQFDQERESRSAAVVRLVVRAKHAVQIARNQPFVEGKIWEYLRFLVGCDLARLDEYCGQESLFQAVENYGVQVTAEDEEKITLQWISEYLDGCDTATLWGWLVWLRVHNEGGDASESGLAAAEPLLGIEAQPQTLAEVA